MKYTIEGDNLPVVICEVSAGESLITEAGGMSWMTPGIEMSTSTEGGIGKAFGRMFSGESIFMNRYTCTTNTGKIAFASSMPGSIIPFEIAPGKGIVAQKSAFLASESTVELSVQFSKKLGRGLFGGEGFIMQKLSGHGTAFVEIDGHCVVHTLQPGESMIIDTGNLAAMEESVHMDVQTVKGVKNILFGGEGLFHTVVTGPGKIWLQTMPIKSLAERIIPFVPTSK